MIHDTTGSSATTSFKAAIRRCHSTPALCSAATQARNR